MGGRGWVGVAVFFDICWAFALRGPGFVRAGVVFYFLVFLVVGLRFFFGDRLLPMRVWCFSFWLLRSGCFQEPGVATAGVVLFLLVAAARFFPGAGSRPGGRGTFLCFAKETYPKERRPCCLRPRSPLANGATCGARSRGGAVELTTRLQRFVRAAPASQFTKRVCPAAHPPTPCPVLLGAYRREGRRFGSLLRSTWPSRRCAPARLQCSAVRPLYPVPSKGRAQRRPESLPARVAVPRSTARRVRMRAAGHACFVN